MQIFYYLFLTEGTFPIYNRYPPYDYNGNFLVHRESTGLFPTTPPLIIVFGLYPMPKIGVHF